MSRPTGLIASKGIELLSWGTPNGYKASILLEELKQAYNLPYTVQAINISTNVQKEPWFIAVNPNGRIPAIVDHDNNGLPVFEGSAILGYLTRKYDVDRKFSFDVESDDYTIAESWIGWQMGGIGPMQGQANHFLRAAPEPIPWAIQRYVGESERLYGVLNTRLADRDYVAGPQRGRYSIADIALLGWALATRGATISLDQFPHVKAWLERCYERPAVKKGFEVPKPPMQSALWEPSEETAAKNEELAKTVAQAKEKHGYKYQSP